MARDWPRSAATRGLVALGAALVPGVAAAHVKYFEDTSRYPLRTDLILSERTLLTVVAAVLGLGALWLLQRLLRSPHWPELPFLRLMAVGAPTLLAVQAAIGLVHAAVQPVLFAPNLPLPQSVVGYAVAAVQLLIAFCLITGIGDWVAALVLLLMGPLALLFYPAVDVLEQFFWAGIAAFVLIVGRFAADASRARPWFRARNPAWSARAVALLRVITGLAIIAPAFSEKIWNPEIGQAFLAGRPWFNVPHHYLGLTWFSDDLFVLLAGITEAVIGVLLVSGLLTRVVILGMWLPFNLAVPFLPPQELLGHLPIFGIMYVLLVHSAGIAPGESLQRQAPPGAPRPAVA